MEEQGVTSGTVLTKPDKPLECSTTCRGPLSTAPRPSWRSTKAVWCPPYYTALNAGGWQRATSPNCQSFIQKNLRIILQSLWPDTISDQQLLARCNQDSMETIIMWRRWRWIGHVMSREQDNITRTALHWKPEGKCKRGRPRNTWRRTVETELKTMQHTWGTIQRLAQNRQTWRSFVAALRATRHNGHEWVSD